MVDDADAVAAAERWLDENDIPYADRTVCVVRDEDSPVVVFSPPEGMRAGEFRLRIDDDGTVADVAIER